MIDGPCVGLICAPSVVPWREFLFFYSFIYLFLINLFYKH